MQLLPVTSSAISEIGWHNQVGLVVRFRGGKIWSYNDDDHALFDAIMSAPSKGQAFDRLVKKMNVTGVEITEHELATLIDDTEPPAANQAAWYLKTRNPVMYLGELLKSNRQSAYF